MYVNIYTERGREVQKKIKTKRKKQRERGNYVWDNNSSHIRNTTDKANDNNHNCNANNITSNDGNNVNMIYVHIIQVFMYIFMYILWRETDRERERGGEGDIGRERERETERQSYRSDDCNADVLVLPPCGHEDLLPAATMRRCPGLGQPG